MNFFTSQLFEQVIVIDTDNQSINQSINQSAIKR